MQLKTIKLVRTLLNILNIVVAVLTFLMIFVVGNEVNGGTFYNGKLNSAGDQMVFNFGTITVLEDGVPTKYYYDSYAVTVMKQAYRWLFNNGQWLRWIILGLSAAVLVMCMVSMIKSIIHKRGRSAILQPIVIILQLAVCYIFTGVTITAPYIQKGSIIALTICGYFNVALTFLGLILNFVLNSYFDDARKEYAAQLQHEKFKDKSFDENKDSSSNKNNSTNNTITTNNDTNKPQGKGIPINAGGNEIFLNISLADVLGAQGINVNQGRQAPQPAPVNNYRPAQVEEEDEEESNSLYGHASSTGGRQRVSNDAAVNDLLAPSAVHAPGSRNTAHNAGRDALAELNARERHNSNENAQLKFARKNNEPDEDEEKKESKPVNAQVDLAAFGIDVSTIKTEEDYKAALEKILQGNLQPLAQQEEVEDDTPDPSDSDLDYELQQVEDSDLNDDEIRELKLIIGDPSNMTFIQKFEAADEDIRKKYLRLRYILLSSKEKRCMSRITRYFDTYYWHNRIVARISLQGKTIKLFLALDPADYKDKKISISDESAKLIYRNCPTLIRVRTDMSYKNGKKLISDMLGTRESDMYTPPAIEFKEKQVDLNYVKPTEPAPEDAPAPTPAPAPVEESAAPAPEASVQTTTGTPHKVGESLTVEELAAGKRAEPVLPEIDENEPTTIIEHKEEPKVDDGGFDVEIDEFGNEIKHDDLVSDKPESDEETSEEEAEDKEDSEEVEETSTDEETENTEESDMFSDDSEGEESDEDSDDGDEEDEDGEDEGDEDGEAKPARVNPFLPRGDGTSSPSAPRKTFAEKIVTNEDPMMGEHYNELKSFLSAYGLKGRVAKSNESFRFKKELYAKFTVQGKTLKVFLAVDPQRYIKSKIPVKDMSAKHAYAQVPCLIKVRSNLSVKRCKQVIEEMMAEKGLLQKEVNNLDYVELLNIGLTHDSKY